MLLASRRPVVGRAVPVAVPGGMMSGPSALGFARGRAGVSWLVLIAATLLSYALGAEHGVGSVMVVVVLGHRGVQDQAGRAGLHGTPQRTNTIAGRVRRILPGAVG